MPPSAPSSYWASGVMSGSSQKRLSSHLLFCPLRSCLAIFLRLHLGQLEEAGGCAVLDERCALPPCMRSQEDSACRPCPTPASESEPRAHHSCRRVCGARRRSGAWERCAPLVPAR